jgi:hypothetical protein
MVSGRLSPDPPIGPLGELMSGVGGWPGRCCGSITAMSGVARGR